MNLRLSEIGSDLPPADHVAAGEAYGFAPEALAMMRATIEALPQLACVCDAEGRVLVANRLALDFGADRLADWRGHRHPDDKDTPKQHSADDLQVAHRVKAPSSVIECRLANAAGGWSWFGLKEAPIALGERQDLRLVTALWVDECKSDIDTIQGTYDLMVKMLDACDDCIKVITPDGKLQHLNRAGCAALGLSSSMPQGADWVPLLPPDVQQLAHEALAVAQSGETGRFLGRTQSANGGLQYWDNLLTPIFGDTGAVESIICISRDISAETIYARELESAKADLQRLADELNEALAAKGLLASEMMHRIKNLFTVVTGLISMSKREVPLDHAGLAMMEGLSQRVFAMARATEILAQKTDSTSLKMTIDPLAVSQAVLSPYQGHFSLEGAVQPLSQHQLTPLVLLVHELATNSLKHGALRHGEGRLSLQWSEGPGRVRLDWVECGGPSLQHLPEGEGFGSVMLRNIAKMSGWAISHDWHPEGLRVKVDMGRS